MQCDVFMFSAYKGVVLGPGQAQATRIIGWGWPHSVPDNARNSQKNLLHPMKVARSPGHNLNGVTFHSLRHTFISAMANAGVSKELRMEIVSQTTGSVHKVYTPHEAEHLRSPLTNIPGIL